MKVGKAPGPSGIKVEMIRAVGDTGASMIHHLTAATICDSKVSSDWEHSFIVCLYKVKGDTSERGTTVVSNWQSRSWKSWRPHQKIGVNRQFPVQLRPRQRHNRRKLCCQVAAREVSSCQQEILHGFCRPGEGIFFWVPQKVIWWVLRKPGVEQWIVRLVHVHVGVEYSEEFEVKIGLYSAHYPSSLCLKPCHKKSALGSPGKTSLQMTLLSSLNCLSNVSGGSLLGKKQWRRKDCE